MNRARICTLAATAVLVLAVPLWAGDATQTVRGKVTAVDPTRKEITITPRRGEPVKLTVDDRSELQLHGGSGKLDQVRQGTRARATYEVKGGVNRVVTLRDPLAGLNRAQELTGNALNAAQRLAFASRDEYRRRLEAIRTELNERIDELKERADEGDAATRQRAAQDLAQLEQKRQELDTWLARVNSATADTWQDVQAGVFSVINDIQQTIDRTRGRLAPKE